MALQSGLIKWGELTPTARILWEGLQTALHSRPIFGEVSAYLKLLQDEGLDPQKMYDQVVELRKGAFPDWPPAPRFAEVDPGAPSPLASARRPSET